MFNQLKLALGLAMMGLFAVGCGGGGGGSHGDAHASSGYVVVFVNGEYGYYSGNSFCDYGNNYCGSGNSLGISNNGCDFNGLTCNNSGNNTANNGSGNNSGNNGSGNNSGNNGSGNNGSGNAGNIWDGTQPTVGNSNNGSGNGSNDVGGNGPSLGHTNPGGTATTQGPGNGSGNNGSGNNSANNGSGNSQIVPINNYPIDYPADPYNTYGNNNSGNNNNFNNGNNGSNNFGNNGSGNNGNGGFGVDQDTKDVNLQRSEIADADFESRVQSNSQQFSMSVESARSLTQLSDRMNMLSNQGQLTDDDRDALAHSALAVAGVNDSKAVSDAIAKMANHDNSAVNSLLDKAATNLGMSSSAGLRDQILPAFGIQIPQN